MTAILCVATILSLAWICVCSSLIIPSRLNRFPSQTTQPLSNRAFHPQSYTYQGKYTIPCGVSSSNLYTSQVGDVDTESWNDLIISPFDEPIRTMLIIFSIVMVLLVGLKATMTQMDEAIEKVLVEYESTMTRFFPQQWKTIADKLDGFEGDERNVKLLALIEDLFSKDPDLMSRVKQKLDR